MSWRQFFKIFILTALGLVLAAAALVLILCRVGVINPDAPLRRMSARKTAALRADRFTISFHDGSAAAADGSALLIASATKAELFDVSGSAAVSVKTSLTDPAVSCDEGFFAAYDAGGSGLYVFSHDELLFSETIDGAILSAAVNERGWTAVCSTEDRYRGAVTVFDPEGEAVYKLYSAEAFPVAARVAPKGYGLAVLRVGTDGSHVDFYDMRQEGSRAAFTAPGTILADLVYLNNDRLLLIGSSGLFMIDSSGALIGSMELRRFSLMAYAAADGFASVLTASPENSGGASLLTLDTDCRIIASLELPGGASGISQRGRYLAVLTGDRLTVYNRRLMLCDEFDVSGYSGIPWMRRDGSAAVLTSSAVYSFG